MPSISGTTTKIVPVILSGGSGTRLWPLSRPECPKQLLSLTAVETMFQLTLGRTAGLEAAAPIIVANASHAEMIESQLADVGQSDGLVILEPTGRNTAPAIALAAAAAEDPSAALLVMPSDHVIADVPAFHDAIAKALPLVAEGWLVTFGIMPDAPETGYGYIRLGADVAEGVQQVGRFVEKPSAEKAAAMLAEGSHVWNAGIFLFRADAYLNALTALQPEMMSAICGAMDGAERTGNRLFPEAEAFARCPSDSIDYAVMERAEKVACAPVSMGWSDVGSWDSLHAIAERDEQENALRGEVIALGSSGCLVHSDGPRVTLVDVDDLIVVAAGGDILILPRGKSQEVRRAVEAHKAKKA